MKQRNQRYLLSELSAGDVFYFQTDRKKSVFRLADTDTFFIKIQQGFHIKYANCLRYDPTRKTGFTAEKHKADRYIIYLRNAHAPKQSPAAGTEGEESTGQPGNDVSPDFGIS